jgi:hypothetical protein
VRDIDQLHHVYTWYNAPRPSCHIKDTTAVIVNATRNVIGTSTMVVCGVVQLRALSCFLLHGVAVFEYYHIALLIRQRPYL